MIRRARPSRASEHRGTVRRRRDELRLRGQVIERPLIPGWAWHCSCLSYAADSRWTQADALADYCIHAEKWCAA